MPISTHTNPGTVDPAAQAYPAAGIDSPPAREKASAALTSSSGELQLPALRPSWAKESPVRGLPAEVMADGQSQVRPVEAAVAETRPPARDVAAGSRRPGGGIPANVYVR